MSLNSIVYESEVADGGKLVIYKDSEDEFHLTVASPFDDRSFLSLSKEEIRELITALKDLL